MWDLSLSPYNIFMNLPLCGINLITFVKYNYDIVIGLVLIEMPGEAIKGLFCISTGI